MNGYKRLNGIKTPDKKFGNGNKRLFQAQLGLYLSSHIVAEGCADIRHATSDIHDVDITTLLTNGLDGINHLGRDGLHLLLRSATQRISVSSCSRRWRIFSGSVLALVS